VKIKCLIHEAEEGGFWAEVPSLPGCFTEGETLEETLGNLREAIACYLDDPPSETPLPAHTRMEVVEI
jgi:predicted RNase H-like HicB family nuclease